MEIIRKNIHMNRWRGSATSQITLDDDFIVPDTMDDMAQVLLQNGEVQIESVRNQSEKAVVKGKMDFQVLYRKAEGGLQTLGGAIPFEETVNVSELQEKDMVSVSWELEDLQAEMINSRKLGAKAIVTLHVKAETVSDVEAAEDVDMGEAFSLEKKRKTVETASLSIQRKDTHRIKEELSLSGSKPNMEQLLWKEMKLRSAGVKPLDGKVSLDGELMVFLIYAGEGEGTPVQWMEESIPFSGMLELPEVTEGMIPAVTMRLAHKDIEMKPDFDGEMRELDVDAVVELDMKFYEEKPEEFLEDVYSTGCQLNVETKDVFFDRMIAKNTCKSRVSEKVSLHNPDKILQICHSSGSVKVEEAEAADNSLAVEGILEVTLLYLTNDDAVPVQSETAVVPFSCSIEAEGITKDSNFQIMPSLEQLTAVMMGGDSVEIKAVVSLDVLVMQPVRQQVIANVTEAPLDMKKIKEMPGITGYIVQPDDTLWDIGKRYHTTAAAIMTANELTEERVKAGDRLILVKDVGR